MRKSVLISLGALIVVSALFLACGGSDDKGSNSNITSGGGGNGGGNVAELQGLQVAKGLSVANLFSNGNQNTSAESAGGGGSGGAAPSADDSVARSASGAYGVGGSGNSGGDISAQQTNTTDNTGITVQGYGSATADADSAIVEFGFSNISNGSAPYPYPDGPVKTDGAGAITRETLQPIIDALVGAGVNANDIELLNQSYYYDYYSSYGTLRATISNLTILDAAVSAAQDAAGNVDSVYLNSTNIIYTLQNCGALERAAAQAAVEDAGDRAAVLADVLDVSLGSVAGASDYSWYNYGTGCGSDYYSPYPIAYNAWRSGGSGDGTVQVVSNISVTYAFS